MGGGVLPLALAGVGVLMMYRILVRLRAGASLKDTVVVITGASSGLGKGRCLTYKTFSTNQVSLICSSGEIAYIHTCLCMCIAECAQVFHAAGARLVLCGRDANRLQQVVEELTASSAETQRKVCVHTLTQHQTKRFLVLRPFRLLMV